MTKKFITAFDESVVPNINEFKKSFLETFLWIKYPAIDKNPFLIFIKHVEENTIHSWNNKVGNISITANNEHDIWAEWPETGYFSFKQEDKPTQIFWFAKQPARQWKKAPCQTNCHVTISPHNNYIGKAYYKTALTQELLDAAFNKLEKISLKEAAELLHLFDREVIINKKYILTPELDPKYKKITGLLWFYFKPVARIHLKTLDIITLDPLFKQEVLHLYKGIE